MPTLRRREIGFFEEGGRDTTQRAIARCRHVIYNVPMGRQRTDATTATKRKPSRRSPVAAFAEALPFDPADVHARLLAWYDAHRRDLPWRRRGQNAYAQLLAEFMLQQTQVATVIPYYERFLARFPTVADLAAGPLDDVLALWSGLGYYSRARNLFAAAQQIVERFAGQVPSSVDDLMSLPGIGRYTAGAIASVAFDERAPILDGNVTRVLMRWLCMEADPTAPATRDRLWHVADAILPPRRCGDFNQALMELGATICAPISPQCLLCPVREPCGAQRAGATDRIPPPRQRAAVKSVEVVVVAISKGDHLLFRQRPADGLWGGLWELPSEPLLEEEKPEEGRTRLLATLPFACDTEKKPLPPVSRTLTHRRMTFRTWRATLSDPIAAPLPDHYRWLTRAQFPTIGLSRACQAILDQLNW